MPIKKKEVAKFFGRFLTFFIVSAGIIAGTVLVDQFPPPRTIWSNDQFNTTPYVPPEFNASEYNVLLDQHSHTIHSDGVLTPEQNILWHIAHGFNACVVTDHQTIKGGVEAQKIARQKYPGFKVIIGEEWTTSRIHMNLLGINETVWVPLFRDPTDLEIQQAINKTHELGGVVTVNHIPWSLDRGMDHPTREDLRDWGVDYIEVVNGATFDNETDIFCDSNPTVGKITGTDMHSPGAVSCWTLLNVTTFTEEAIMDELRNLNTDYIFNQSASPDYSGTPDDNPWYEFLKPIMIIGDTFESIFNEGAPTIVLSIVFLVGAFMVGELLRKVKRIYWKNVHERRSARKASKSTN